MRSSTRRSLVAVFAAAAVGTIGVGLAQADATGDPVKPTYTKGSNEKPSVAELKVANEQALAWYGRQGIDVRTVVKDGYVWAYPDEADLRAAAAAKGVPYVSKSKVAGSKKLIAQDGAAATK